MKRVLIHILTVGMIILMLCSTLCSYVAAASPSQYSPYANIEYDYSAAVTSGTIRYISQISGSKYFDSKYWGKWESYARKECGTCCISMSLSYIGINKTPLNILNEGGGKTIFQKAWGGATALTYNASDLSTAIDNYLYGGGKYSPPIIHLNKYSQDGHFVIIVGYISENTYQVMDPGNSKVCWTITINGTSATYMHPNANVGKIITDSLVRVGKKADIVQYYSENSYSNTNGVLDINGYLDGVDHDFLSNYGTFDVYINGVLVADNVNDYCAELPVGTTYEITDIKPSNIHKFLGMREGSLSGTVGPGSNVQRMQFRTLDNVGDDFYAFIINRGCSNFLYKQADNNVTGQPFVDLLDEIWHFERLEDGTYKITSLVDGYSLDVQGYGSTPGTNVCAVPYSGNTAQRWGIFQEDEGCILSAVCTPCVLSEDGTTGNVQMADDNGSANQWFEIRKIEPVYTYDINGNINGTEVPGTDNYGTYDVWINGVQVADDVVDFCQNLNIGTRYEIKDIKVNDGCSYNGLIYGTLSGTITSANQWTVLQFADIDFSGIGEPAGEVTANGHRYVYYPADVSWYTADAFCKEMGGHMVTITSSDENALVQSLSAENDVWLGATDSECEGTWQWVTGEPFVYGNWRADTNEPNNDTVNDEGGENYASITPAGGWNDIYGYATYGFIVEYEEDGNLQVNGYLDGKESDTLQAYGTVDVYIDGVLVADDVADFTDALTGGTEYEIRDIRPADGYSYNGIQSGSRAGFIAGDAAVTFDFSAITRDHIGEASQEVVWNGHKYAVYSTPVTWYTAKVFCEELGGSLVTITSEEENTFVRSLCGEGAWMGATDAGAEGEWNWISEEPFSYTAWMRYEPNNVMNNDSGEENYGIITSNGWNDDAGYRLCGFICESSGYEAPAWQWSADYTTATAVFASIFDGTTVEITVTPEKNDVDEVTCEKDGRLEYYAEVMFEGTCYSDTQYEIIYAAGHALGEWTTTAAPDCENAGEEYRGCANCDYNETRVIPAWGHTYQETVTEATCTTGGYTRHSCTTCGDTYEDAQIAPLGHDYECAVTVAPTKHSSGELYGTCSRCGGAITVIIPALNTTDYAYSIVKQPSYTETGIGRYILNLKTYGEFYFDVVLETVISDTTPHFAVETKAAVPGDTVNVTISLKNNPGITSMKLKVAFDDVLTLTNVVYNADIGGQPMPPVSMNSPFTLNWFDGLRDVEGDWVFVTLTFTVAEDAVSGTSAGITVTFDENDLCNVAEENVAFAVINGAVEIIDYMPGDINGDGAVNNKDVTRLFRYLSDYEVEVEDAALDINGDGTVNNKDLTRLFRYVSGYDVTIN